ncbi:PIN domain-containing protein [Microaerobacter geothermalis]|uniref:type II toxin-antitoxin system VapC family toxin n=1 Tax=Microaerobacter geothermalis TaxID=674972 RepID=UPI001F28C11E|nr:PIN domain-containing protein [Microaerobacter geothermalis]MCF6093278.1 PIN domain-containing protein [Microaerobacter geothermalis]
MNVLIDTNIIIDAITGRAPFNENAERIFLLAAADKINACLTANSITDIYYLSRRYLHSTEEAKNVLMKLFTIFRVLDVSGNDCEKALESQMPDYEDALLAACGKRNKVDCIVTRNIKDFKNAPVRTLSPDDFLTEF